jgi:hypothetical protein
MNMKIGLVSALHCGQVGAAHQALTSETIRLADRLGIRRTVMMSACPGSPADRDASG